MRVTAPSRPPSAAMRGRARPRGRQALLGWLYATPTAVFVVALFAVPLLLVIRMSVSRWPLLTGDQGVNAPDNFVKAVNHRFFTDSVVFTIKYTVLATVLLLALGLGLALLVQESSRWNNLLRASFLIPSALGLASASLLFYVLYSPYASPLAPVLDRLGITFLGSPTAALISTTFLIVWRYAGFYMVLMLVGLQGIPADVYEAARADGASRWQTFRKITLPLLRPTLALTTVLCVTGSLLAFEQFYILTKGGPDNSTITVVQLIYMVAFQGQNDLGVAAALSLIVLLALVLINALQLRAFRSEES
ncbi:carbohydrate ABC transporter permease [Micromonospora parathelypteridis]|uniref:Multiple sugar transport system permease protein n=2 Tax=Micromonospora parathelypteridis TaxID=1839617 RepID=A0A840W9U5_9ACTN|nr:sugar ABC transporter permease [Micromonospora parathelypteridis]MBB5480889.1 multiple sugar transport system permease protein [Micromonospora parathelypteridis]GGO21126.1 sugar ABC transporter permease [Micromonospora parathelypteridis]